MKCKNCGHSIHDHLIEGNILDEDTREYCLAGNCKCTKFVREISYNDEDPTTE